MVVNMEEVVESSDSELLQSENETTTIEEKNNQGQEGNPKLADALAKVIRMSKNNKGKSIVLSKAKLYSPNPITKKSHGFEIEPDPNKEFKSEPIEDDVKPDVEDIKPSKKELKKFKITKQERIRRGRLKPSPLDREKERPLVKIATKGVVQLFNAVRQQQSAINKQINKPGVTESKKEKILKSIDKKAFLDVLRGKDKIQEKVEPEVNDSREFETEVKSEPEDEPSWQVLKDDFMMGAKLKDWDKKEMELMIEEE